MHVRILARQEAGTRRRAERGSREHIAEERSFSGNPVNVRRFEKRMADAAQFVPAKIIYQNEYHVGLNPIHGARRALAGHGYREGQ
jgi:hypothetical protein